MTAPAQISIVQSIKLIANYLKNSCHEVFGIDTKVQLIIQEKGIIEALERQSPDMIVLGCDLMIKKDIKLMERIKNDFKQSKIILMCDSVSEFRYQTIKMHGISGLFSMQIDIQEFKENLYKVWFENKIYTPAKFQSDDSLKSNKEIFTEKELTILELVRRQLTSKEIASELGVHIKTIEFHKSKMMEKTNSTKMVGVLEFASNNNIL